MSRVDLFNGVKITVEATSKTYHSYDDLGLYITNTDYIKEPKQYTRYLEVPGRNGMLDLSETVAGRQIYTSREINVKLAGTRNKTDWDSVISDMRNDINGKICRLTFDNDPNYFWRGRVEIKGFNSALNLGKLELNIPTADPYKYNILTSAEPWLWDPFNFETDMITQIGAVTITGSGTITIPHGYMPTNPQIVVSDLLSATFEVTCDSSTYELSVGSNVIPSIFVGGASDTVLSFTGSATVQIVYRGGSL